MHKYIDVGVLSLARDTKGVLGLHQRRHQNTCWSWGGRGSFFLLLVRHAPCSRARVLIAPSKPEASLCQMMQGSNWDSDWRSILDFDDRCFCLSLLLILPGSIFLRFSEFLWSVQRYRPSQCSSSSSSSSRMYSLTQNNARYARRYIPGITLIRVCRSENKQQSRGWFSLSPSIREQRKKSTSNAFSIHLMLRICDLVDSKVPPQRPLHTVRQHPGVRRNLGLCFFFGTNLNININNFEQQQHEHQQHRLVIYTYSSIVWHHIDPLAHIWPVP